MKKLVLNILLLTFVIVPNSAQSFWVVNFGTARTLHKGKFGFAAGVGGKMVFLGQPKLTSAFFTIPHVGFRYGLFENLDVGLRLAPIPLPFASVGPSFGANLDFKYCFTRPESKFDFAAVAGFGGAHVLMENKNRAAYSPNFAFLGTYNLNQSLQFTMMARYVNLEIPTAVSGASANNVNISGVTFGIKKSLRPNISILPEIGVFNYQGGISGVPKNGIGFQFGVMLATSF
jgi:hypothetical protein